MQKNWFAIFNDHLLNSIVNQKECQLAENPKRKSRPKLKPKPKSRLSKKIKKKTKTNKKAVLARENTKDIRRMIQERRNSVHQSLQNKDEQIDYENLLPYNFGTLNEGNVKIQYLFGKFWLISDFLSTSPAKEETPFDVLINKP